MAIKHEWDEVVNLLREQFPEISGWDERVREIQEKGFFAELVHVMGTSGSSAAIHTSPEIIRDALLRDISNLEWKAGHPERQGHYRLTGEEIEYRRSIVRQAISIRKETHDTWGNIAMQLEIATVKETAERKLRAWRHNLEYQ
jgi:hypothetical protein